MQHLPRRGGPDAADVSVGKFADGVVPEMPPRAGEVYSAEGSGVQYEVCRAGESDGDRTGSGEAVSRSQGTVDQLQCVSSVVVSVAWAPRPSFLRVRSGETPKPRLKRHEQRSQKSRGPRR